MGINIQEQDKILIVAPHPDDESIGCGGLLSMYASQCDVLLITDGERGGKSGDVAKVRQGEFIEAMTVAGVKKYSCLHIPQHQIKANRKIVKGYDFSKYQHIFVPNRLDAHQDHVAVYKVIKSITKRLNPRIRIYEYEVWSTLHNPNIYLDISNIYDKKKELIECHKSQMAEMDYVGMILGLNAYRGRSHGYPFAECYYCAKEKRAQQIRRCKRRLRNLLN